MRWVAPLLLIGLSSIACKSLTEPDGSSGQAKPAAKPPQPVAQAAQTAVQAAKPAEAAAKPPEPPKPPEPAPEPPADPKFKAPDDVGQAPKDAQPTASGLATKVLTKGKGKKHPTDTDQVKVHYTGWQKTGRMFDSSVQRGQPTTFGVKNVIPGWTEALKLMVEGEKRRVWIPSKLAYGDSAGMGAPTGDLVFDVELIEIMAAPTVPEDVKAAPDSATKTASGLAYRVIKKGTGTTHPGPTSRVTVHYSGWTTDGKMFDSSVARGEPTSFGLNQVIPGWTEGVQLMVVGEKTRFWIPGNLAYGDTPRRPGAPAGTLVFDVELIKID